MEKEFIERVLIEAINYTADENGWANLAELGGILRENGIRYGKLNKFLQQFDYLVETQADETKFPPVVFVRLLIQY